MVSKCMMDALLEMLDVDEMEVSLRFLLLTLTLTLTLTLISIQAYWQNQQK